MLSKPDCGWTTFQLGSENTAYCLGYLTDVAMEWLDQAIHGLETEDVFSVHGFCEPGRMVCTVSFWNCYVIFEGDGKDDVCESVYTVHVSMLDFCKQLYADIAGNLDAWVRWEDFEEEEEPDPESADARSQELQRRLDTLKQLIDARAEDYEDGAFC